MNVTVYSAGGFSTEIGFQLRNHKGAMVYERVAGGKIYGNIVLGTFCPECVNLAPV